ncbi:hypothetical protein PCANC_11914 [Puccinia coronata f. sp. avenae]|uniref:Uncharacterized protein n=1 Tax=Puccinia coronata f. sp. avenae TaxID=200324 RepID=A0A2N5V606_9BASI|nr:hypothetical protein PCASD_18243 [Puccinia coronata f. sp. avenae]PLW14904.1 hypothetical protein PCANC_14784 [Puccinia coronata f. sp. avenae]PLW43073.1 hypothetical protein PCASD_06091 [Puccinia coronata f. sp. avenae]PLW45425.1 hypothetical protein PCANC_11914 [Puccinia coronata f. sp. avenae]
MLLGIVDDVEKLNLVEGKFSNEIPSEEGLGFVDQTPFEFSGTPLLPSLYRLPPQSTEDRHRRHRHPQKNRTHHPKKLSFFSKNILVSDV